MSGELSGQPLSELPLEELMAQARARRDATFGSRVTYSPKVFIPLTMLCRDKCGYCTFAQPPARLESPYLSPEQVLAIARRGARAGCHEALFTLGERPEERYPSARSWLDEHGYDSTVAYLAAMCELVRDEVGLLPHANAGALYADELAMLRPVAASQGMMIESLNDDLACHRGSPDKTAARRLATLEAAGELAIPFTTGILVGIGESRADRITALEAIAASHRRHGHVQEVIVQNFLPKDGTAMHNAPPCPPDEFLDAIALARLILPAEVHLQAPPNLSDDFGVLLAAGIDDWGGVSPVTADHVNPERPWPALDRLDEVTTRRGSHPRSPTDRLSRVRARSRSVGSTRRCASRCSTAPMPKGSAATTPVRCSCSASRRRHPSRSTRASRCCTSVHAARRGTRAPMPNPRHSSPAPVGRAVR